MPAGDLRSADKRVAKKETIGVRASWYSSRMVSLVGSSEVPSFGRLIGRRGGVRKALLTTKFGFAR
jgi:hypothetical protein